MSIGINLDGFTWKAMTTPAAVYFRINPAATDDESSILFVSFSSFLSRVLERSSR